MNLRKVLTRDTVRLNLPGETKDQVIEALVNLLVATGKVNDPKAALECVLERERKMSTGMKHGIAIPHGKTDAVDGLLACIGVKPEGIDFASLDGEASTIFVMTLSPTTRTGPHLQFLAEVSQLLKSPETRRRILQARDEQQVLRILTD
jgi:PTS system nitrogen regulatory IIA component